MFNTTANDSLVYDYRNNNNDNNNCYNNNNNNNNNTNCSIGQTILIPVASDNGKLFRYRTAASPLISDVTDA